MSALDKILLRYDTSYTGNVRSQAKCCFLTNDGIYMSTSTSYCTDGQSVHYMCGKDAACGNVLYTSVEG